MNLKKQTETKRKYTFNEWNVVMALAHNKYEGNIFQESEQLKPEELYPSNLLRKYKVK